MFLPDNLDLPAATSQSQSQRREILRPPPFLHFNAATQQSSLGAKDENDGNVAVQDGRYYDQKNITLLLEFHLHFQEKRNWFSQANKTF